MINQISLQNKNKRKGEEKCTKKKALPKQQQQTLVFISKFVK